MPRRQDPDPDPGSDDRGPSKTALKAQAHALQRLGRELAGLPAERLAAVAMPEPLREAILAWQRTRTHEGRRRQMQYVGKLIRGADEAPLREAVDAFRLGTAQDALALHQAEHWRAQLVADDEALARWLAEHPATDAQRLRSLVRAARRDGAALDPAARQPRSWRELFQFLRPLLAAGGGGSAAAPGARARDPIADSPETRP
ncbi:MAG: DUF615 domain-containing protein [Burkholderiales bacterium]|nr:DUF615 domain-containing protein [Burkholderiales bacterium]